MNADIEAARAAELLDKGVDRRRRRFFETLRRDRDSYKELGNWYLLSGFWVVAIYRFGSWVHSTVHMPLFRLPLLFCYWLIKQPLRFFLHVEIPARAKLGAGLCLPHPCNIFVGGHVVLGEDCTIFHEVTIGHGPIPGIARIGHHVVLFPGARILGGIAIGDRSEIGANCVVMKDVPEASLVMPNATRVVAQTLVRSRSAAVADE